MSDWSSTRDGVWADVRWKTKESVRKQTTLLPWIVVHAELHFEIKERVHFPIRAEIMNQIYSYVRSTREDHE